MSKIALAAFTSLVLLGNQSLAEEQVVRYVPSADDQLRQGFIRIVNNSSNSGTVTVTGTDDDGVVAPEITFTLGANETIHINSEDLEVGNSGKGLNGFFGDGSGDWYLAVESSLDFDLHNYLRTSSGFMTSMNDLVTEKGSRFSVPIFNPGSNLNQVSSLRITNLEKTSQTISVTGIDDAGNTQGPIIFSIGASSTVSVTAEELEQGSVEKGFSQGIGDGSGKWRLNLEANGAISLLNLLTDPNGNISNLSAGSPENDVFVAFSNDFENGGEIPSLSACDGINGHTGGNKSPHIQWQNAPAATHSFAIVMDDEISPCGVGEQACGHWTVVNIPLGTSQLSQNDILSGMLESADGYIGPCPPNGNHVYNITVYALGENMPTLSNGDVGSRYTRSQFESAYGSHILDKATLHGRYGF